jgi:hypothetical protein
MSTGRVTLILLGTMLILLLAACVPESDLERAPGGRVAENEDLTLTPIPEEELPEIAGLELRVAGVSIHRSAGRVTAEISLIAGIDARVEIAGAAKVEWSDGEVSDALPLPVETLLIESRRSDSSETAVPVRLHLTRLSYLAGTDVHGEMTPDEIVTEWGSFPILSVEQARRPPGWDVTYQAAGQRWISRLEVIHEGRHRPADGEAAPFADGFRPTTGTLHFGLEYEDFEGDLPLVTRVDVRVAVPEVEVEL